MLRPFLSLVVAAVGTVAGLSLTWLGVAAHARASAALASDPLALVQTIVGVLLLTVAALSLAIHWVGVFVVGAVHALLGLLALTAPFGNPFGGGIFSPVFQITRMLATVDQTLSDGAAVFYFSGTALVIGAFLVGAALGVRSRRLAGPSSVKAITVSSVLGGIALLAASAILLLVGGTFVRAMLAMFRFDGTLAALTVVGGAIAGFAGILLRWSSVGVLLAGGIALLVGVYLFASPTVLGPSGSLLGDYGLLIVAGATFLAAAGGGVVRGPAEVPDRSDAL